MKTRNVITVIGVAALAAITLSINAGEPLRSPRGLDNEIKMVPGKVQNVSPATESHKVSGSPRALDSRANHVQGTGTVNLTARKCAVIGSPRQAENSTLSCCKVAKGSCTAALECCSGK